MIQQNLHTSLFIVVFSFIFSTKVIGQNVGIGVTNPQKGKLEIAGALGGYSTVLTIGSDGAGISFQRNWPTIGFNQYRDASNTQRFIGAGHAGSIYVSSVDGSMVFSQFGLGTPNQEITNGFSPLVINGFGTTIVYGSMQLKENVSLDKSLVFSTAPRVLSIQSGMSRNLAAYAYGLVASNGSKLKGTENFTSAYNAALGGYLVYFTEDADNAQIVVTPRTQVPCYATYDRIAQGVYLVLLWNKDGVKIQGNFSFSIFQ